MNTLHRVLLVEDSEADRYLAARLLGKVWPGLEVVEARNGVEAIELLERCDSGGPALRSSCSTSTCRG